MKKSSYVEDFFEVERPETESPLNGNTIEKLQRLDSDENLRKRILPLCRLKHGEIWEDKVRGHRVGVLDATRYEDIQQLFGTKRAQLIVNDPPYNVVVGNTNTKNLSKICLDDYLKFSEKWIENVIKFTDKDAHIYIWMGADYKDNFQPLPDFMITMRQFPDLKPKNIITVRNQRGYGTQKNWMWIRQELLYYVKGSPKFNIQAEYTDIPKILRGYYKKVNGKRTENFERGKSPFIRAGNVWVDIQQVFYRMEENVAGCYAQKPLKSIERILLAGSNEKDLVGDFFSHAGTTLIAGDRLNRMVYTSDIDPIYAELSVRRLERLRAKGKSGWQWENPFPELEFL